MKKRFFSATKTSDDPERGWSFIYETGLPAEMPEILADLQEGESVSICVVMLTQEEFEEYEPVDDAAPAETEDDDMTIAAVCESIETNCWQAESYRRSGSLELARACVETASAEYMRHRDAMITNLGYQETLKLSLLIQSTIQKMDAPAFAETARSAHYTDDPVMKQGSSI